MRTPSTNIHVSPIVVNAKDEKAALPLKGGLEISNDIPNNMENSINSTNSSRNPHPVGSLELPVTHDEHAKGHSKAVEVPLEFMFSQSFPLKFASVLYPTTSSFPIQEISPPWSGSSAYNGSSQMVNPAQGHEIDSHSQGETNIKELRKELVHEHNLRQPYVVGSVQPPTSSIDSLYHVESFRQRIWRKTKENPLVPIGALATVAALGMGLRAFSSGDSQKSQRMMRYRILAQGFTLVAFGSGLLYWQYKRSKPESLKSQ